MKIKRARAHHYLRKIFACFVLFLSFTLAGQEKYNIVWITAEDLSPRLGCYGDSIARTPNIDQLAAEGVRYSNAFATYGVCAPSRHSLITGMYPTSTGAMAMRTWRRTSALDMITDPELLDIPVYEATPPPEVKCFSEYLRAAGYYCTNNSKEDYQFKTPVTAWDESSKKAHWRNRPDENTPFFSVFNLFTTHESRTFEKFKPEVTDPNKVEIPPYYPQTETVRNNIARVYDNIYAMDAEVGEIMAQLKEDGLLNKTIVVFFTDHGDGIPRAKRWVYDSGIKVPLIIRYPDGRRSGTVEEELVSFVDFAPATLGLADIESPAYMEGVDFLNKDTPERTYIYAFRDRMDPAPENIRAVRDDRFKYIRNYRPDLPYIGFIPYRDRGPIMQEIHRSNSSETFDPAMWQLWSTKKPLEELYDTYNDPHEIMNLASRPEYFGKLAELRAAHEAFVQEYGDLGQLSETELIKVLWPPDGLQPQVELPSIVQKDGKLLLKCSTPGTSIAYRFDNQTQWQLYTGAIETGQEEKIVVVACRIGWKPSEEVSREL